uniref:Uncharacterized protein n=1 Tax=Rhizophora mucronata TaxID=61149 RepID=A0A2P2IQ77_RHIMU
MMRAMQSLWDQLLLLQLPVIIPQKYLTLLAISLNQTRIHYYRRHL